MCVEISIRYMTLIQKENSFLPLQNSFEEKITPATDIQGPLSEFQGVNVSNRQFSVLTIFIRLCYKRHMK